MIDKIIRGAITLFGLLIGLPVAMGVLNIKFFQGLSQFYQWLTAAIILTFFAILFYFIAPRIRKNIIKIGNTFSHEIAEFTVSEIVLGAVGLIIGLIIAFLISVPLYNIQYFGIVLSIFTYLVMGYLGIKVASLKKEDFANTEKFFSKKLNNKFVFNKNSKCLSCPKVLDTSVIIDGRIVDLCETGFLEGTLVVPEFVLKELRHIADSSDDLKRVRGRRGLDCLKTLQESEDIDIVIESKDYDKHIEVDIKLLKLATDLNGKVMTNDYNLNKVADLEGVDVLNINELAHALKPIILPNEELEIEIVKAGKDDNQGLAYLDDGTMIVVENGKKYIGKKAKINITSVIQTGAGRMIFAKISKKQ